MGKKEKVATIWYIDLEEGTDTTAHSYGPYHSREEVYEAWDRLVVPGKYRILETQYFVIDRKVVGVGG